MWRSNKEFTPNTIKRTHTHAQTLMCINCPTSYPPPILIHTDPVFYLRMIYYLHKFLQYYVNAIQPMKCLSCWWKYSTLNPWHCTRSDSSEHRVNLEAACRSTFQIHENISSQKCQTLCRSSRYKYCYKYLNSMEVCDRVSDRWQKVK